MGDVGVNLSGITRDSLKHVEHITLLNRSTLLVSINCEIKLTHEKKDFRIDKRVIYPKSLSKSCDNTIQIIIQIDQDNE